MTKYFKIIACSQEIRSVIPNNVVNNFLLPIIYIYLFLMLFFVFRDIENEHEDKTKLVATIRVLTKLFAIDEPLPVIYFGMF